MRPYSPIEILTFFACLAIVMIINLFVIFRTEKSLLAIVWALLVVFLPVLGSILYFIYYLARGSRKTAPATYV
ncbi:hypothetical protein CHU92_04755 [Flavobacterium cyanobacteriorum]|uniref:Cardiolipin synthase N-terminal domain-containing protein n=1 Tax=Flavobacterium cyanobacteriorum TaxID=2022802 RepID=A0A255ZAW4_9FLAO|nr:hypothetical protein CHU92_04755 [Flavobacterium cyanobacteriorum]